MSMPTNSNNTDNRKDATPSKGKALPDTGETLPQECTQELEVTGESVDFNSILSAISGNASPTTSDASKKQNPAQSNNLNISSVIDHIQDEGPATRKDSDRETAAMPKQSIDNALHSSNQASADTVPSQQVTEHETAVQRPAAPVVDREQDRARTPDDAALKNGLEETKENKAAVAAAPGTAWATILMRLLVTLLLVFLAGAGYLWLNQQSDNQAILLETIQLRQELQRNRELVEELQAQIHQQKASIEGLASISQVQQLMEAQRQDIDALLQSRINKTVAGKPKALLTSAAVEKQAASKNGEDDAKPAPMPAASAGSTVKDHVHTSPTHEVAKKNNIEAAGEGRASGRWTVHLASSGDRQEAEKALRKYATKAPEARIQKAKVKNRLVYRVSVSGFKTKEEARRYRRSIMTELNIKGVWFSRNDVSIKE